MNEGRLFLYVSPNLLLPLLFTILILASLAIHFSVLNNTTWFADFLAGSSGELAAPAAPAPEPAAVEAAPAMEAAPAEAEAAAE